MHSFHVSNYLRGAGWAVAVCGLAVAVGPLAGAAPNARQSQGLLQKGKLHVDLHRGAVVPLEATVIKTPNNCAGSLGLDIEWDEAKDRVTVKLRGSEVLTPYPDVNRSKGVDFITNPHFPEPVDIVDGRYQLWIIGAAGPKTPFYYDTSTYELLGGGDDFVAPAGAIALEFPTFYLFTSPFFQPNNGGRVKFDWSFSYASPGRGDRPELSYHTLAFVPPDLCHIDQFRIDKTSLRPWISDPAPITKARPWSDYLHGGLMFNVSVEPDEYFVEPPLVSLTGSYSGATVLGGGVPRDWQLDFDAALAGLAPPIVQWAGANECLVEFQGFHDGQNICEPK